MRSINVLLSSVGFLVSCYAVVVEPGNEVLANSLFAGLFVIMIPILISHRKPHLGRKEIFARCPFWAEILMWGLLVVSLFFIEPSATEGPPTAMFFPLYWMLDTAA